MLNTKPCSINAGTNAHFDSPPLPMNSVVDLHSLLPPLDPFVRVLVPSPQVDHSGLSMFHMSKLVRRTHHCLTVRKTETKSQGHLVLKLKVTSFPPIIDGGCREEDGEGGASSQQHTRHLTSR